MIAEIGKAENRPTGPGFYEGVPDENVQLYVDHDEIVTQEFVAEVLDYDPFTKTAMLQVKNHFLPNQTMEIFGPNIPATRVPVGAIEDENGNILEVCNRPMQIVYTKWDGPIEKNAMIRKVKQS